MEPTVNGKLLIYATDFTFAGDDANDKAHAFYTKLCRSQGLDPTGSRTELKHVINMGDNKPAFRLSTYGQMEFVHFLIDFGKVRRDSRTENIEKQRAWYQLAKAFKAQWGDRCPPDVEEAMKTFPAEMRT